MTAPKTLYWAVSGTCHLRCRYCFYRTGMNTLPSDHVNADASRALITSLGTVFQRVVLTGGEPLLNPDFWDLVRLGHGAGMEVCFLTDGIKLGESCVEYLRRYGVSRVYISLDSLDSATNEALRCSRNPTQNVTARIVRNIEDVARHRPPDLSIVVIQTVCRTNITSIEPMVQFCRQRELDLLVHPAGIPDSCCGLDEVRIESCSDAQLGELEAAMLGWAGDHVGRQKYTRLCIDLIRGCPVKGVTCPMGSRAFFLDVDGIMYPCFHRKDLSMGSAKDTSPSELLRRGNVEPNLKMAPCTTLACACMLE